MASIIKLIDICFWRLLNLFLAILITLSSLSWQVLFNINYLRPPLGMYTP